MSLNKMSVSELKQKIIRQRHANSKHKKHIEILERDRDAAIKDLRDAFATGYSIGFETKPNYFNPARAIEDYLTAYAKMKWRGNDENYS